MKETTQKLVERIEEKFTAIDQNYETHLEGMVWAKPITYWDYIQPDALLNLQVQRTTLPDEMVFIMYHQINELLFKMILWEAMLSSSFSIMQEGMEVEQYLKFRNTLTPASGFQSAQYRLIEFASTDTINLIDYRFRATIDRNTPIEHAYEHLYWHAAGKDHTTGKKSTLIRLFEEKYKAEFLRKMEEYNTTNLYAKFKSLPDEVKADKTLIQAMRHYDYTVNVSWVMAHYNAAAKYLQPQGEVVEATGGSDWRKYMHPRYQRRIFFPDLWSAQELEDWGKDV